MGIGVKFMIYLAMLASLLTLEIALICVIPISKATHELIVCHPYVKDKTEMICVYQANR